jgi:hypothetical protein
MAVLKLTLAVLLAMSSQVLALPVTQTEPTISTPTERLIVDVAHNPPAGLAPLKPAPSNLPTIVERLDRSASAKLAAFLHTSAGLEPTIMARNAPSVVDHLDRSASAKLAAFLHHTSAGLEPTKLARNAPSIVDHLDRSASAKLAAFLHHTSAGLEPTILARNAQSIVDHLDRSASAKLAAFLHHTSAPTKLARNAPSIVEHIDRSASTKLAAFLHTSARLESTNSARNTTSIGEHQDRSASTKLAAFTKQPESDLPAHITPAGRASTKPALTAPATTTPAPARPTASPSSTPPYLETATAFPTALDLSPDPKDEYMVGIPTFFCNYRYQLSGNKDHYFLRGRNWNITGEQLENAVKKVVYNTAEWGASPVGGADKDGKYPPGVNTPDDTVTFKYSDSQVPDGVTPGGVQEFAAEVSLS